MASSGLVAIHSPACSARAAERHDKLTPSCGAPIFTVDSQYIQHTTAELPHPATKLVIGQHLWFHPSESSWAWLVVGSFYDDKDNELWNIEVFLGYRDEDDDTETDADQVSEPETTPAGFPNNQEADVVYRTLPSGFRVDNNTNPNLYYVAPQPWAFDVEAYFGSVPINNPPASNFPQANYPATMASQGSGWNPRFGWDNTTNNGTSPGQAWGNPGPAWGNPAPVYANQPFGGMPPPMGYQQPGWGAVPPHPQGPGYVGPAAGYQHPVPVFPGQGAPRFPQPHPAVSADAPAVHLANSTGGAGCEPGYNYFFPAEHTKVHVIKSSTAPWRVPSSMALHYGAYHVPARTTLAELLAGFGATNPARRLNRVTEVLPGGNGRWYKGVTFAGDERDEMKKSLKDLGWDATRTGRSGEKPVVWLWITKD
ncbi:hypothetical protein F4775DRAFT_596664 [Biscogniauxia sp. FL1348]|nr:hypothetical protein F4775DRAFT_596664 [Biscogniauxia sp. FL1348]